METVMMYLVPMVFCLMLMVNIFTEVLKSATCNKIPTNLLVLVLSIVLTIVAMFTYLQIASVQFVWHMLFVAIAVAFCVAYSAMFGFDKFKQMVDQWMTLKK